MIHIALLAPEIPQNTGNIGRSCVMTGSRLHLIRPFLFDLSDKGVKRSGMDYWPKLDLEVHDSFEDFIQAINPKRLWICETQSKYRYDQVAFEDGDAILFGSESKGIPQDILEAYRDQTIRIPMVLDAGRSLNLSNSVAIVLYAALSQLDFPAMT